MRILTPRSVPMPGIALRLLKAGAGRILHPSPRSSFPGRQVAGPNHPGDKNRLLNHESHGFLLQNLSVPSSKRGFFDSSKAMSMAFWTPSAKSGSSLILMLRPCPFTGQSTPSSLLDQN